MSSEPSDGEAENTKRGKRWEGGYIRYDQDGIPTFYIFKKVRGRLYERSTRTHRERAAYEHLRRFEEDPDAYLQWMDGKKLEEQQKGPTPIFLTDDLREEFLEWSSRPKKEGGKGNAPDSKWHEDQRRVLKWWAARFVDATGKQLNLRAGPGPGRVSRELIFRILDGVPERGVAPDQWKVPPAGGVRYRQNILHAFYSWLRKRRRGDRVGHLEDPMLDVPNIQGGPSEINKIVPPRNVHAVINHLIARGSFFGHCLCVQAGVGWHNSELRRFIEGGEMEPLPGYVPNEFGAKYVLWCPRHKSGKSHASKVGLKVACSAAVLLGQALDIGADFPPVDESTRQYEGRWLVRKYAGAVKKACKVLGLPRFHPSWMRHTHVHYAVELGARFAANEKEAQARAAAYVGHAEGSKMVAIHYAKGAIPPKTPSIMDDEASPFDADETSAAPHLEDQERGGAEPAARVVQLHGRKP